MVRFFDEKPADSVGHATAVAALLGEDLGVALLADFFQRRGGTVIVHPESVTIGRQKGPRLDRWVEVSRKKAATLYQVEVKNSSAHAIGGKPLPWNATVKEVAAYKRKRWRDHWDESKRTFWGPARKVLVKMLPPSHLRHLNVESLICFWDALHPSGHADPFFTITARGGDFDHVSVFSMSSYLRTFGHRQIRLRMPAAAARLGWLRSIVRNLAD